MNIMYLVSKVGEWDSAYEHVGVFVSFKDARKYLDSTPTIEVVEGYYSTLTAEKKTRRVSYRITAVDVHPEPRVHPEDVNKVLAVAQEFFPDRPMRLKYEDETDSLFITIEMTYKEGPNMQAEMDAVFKQEMLMCDALQDLDLYGQHQHYNISTGVEKGPDEDV